MHYYKRHIGDYARKAGRFTLLEHGACTLLVDACYDRERFPNDEEAFAWAWARTDEEKQAVRFVLLQLFVKVGDLWVNEQIQEDLEKYHANADKNREIAINRERQKRERARSVHEACTITEPTVNLTTNHKPLTINQEPRTKNQEPRTRNHEPKNKAALPQIVVESRFDEFWQAYPPTDRRTAKKQCFEKWQKNNLDNEADLILSHIDEMKRTDGWQRGYEPSSLTYLNQRRWDGIDQGMQIPSRFNESMGRKNNTTVDYSKIDYEEEARKITRMLHNQNFIQQNGD